MRKVNYIINRLSISELDELAEFVVQENNSSHMNGSMPAADLAKTIRAICNEETCYFVNSLVFAARNSCHNMVGTIRVLKWNHTDSLPIEKIFHIPPSHVMRQFHKKEAWHIGRFAIKSGIRQIKLFKQLMVHAIAPICKNKESIAFAECDSKLCHILSLLGIKSTVTGNPMYYLGSETIPICMTYEDLAGFYEQNSNLLCVTCQQQNEKVPSLSEQGVLSYPNNASILLRYISNQVANYNASV